MRAMGARLTKAKCVCGVQALCSIVCGGANRGGECVLCRSCKGSNVIASVHALAAQRTWPAHYSGKTRVRTAQRSTRPGLTLCGNRGTGLVGHDVLAAVLAKAGCQERSGLIGCALGVFVCCTRLAHRAHRRIAHCRQDGLILVAASIHKQA